MSNGKIELRSVHSSTAVGETSLMWPEADPEGFSLAEKSIVGYGKKFFSESVRESRRLDIQDSDSTENGINLAASSKAVMDSALLLRDPQHEADDLEVQLTCARKQEASVEAQNNAEMKEKGHSPFISPAPALSLPKDPPTDPTAASALCTDPIAASAPPTDPTAAAAPLTDLAAAPALPTDPIVTSAPPTDLVATAASLSDPAPTSESPNHPTLSTDPELTSALLLHPAPVPNSLASTSVLPHARCAISNAFIPAPQNADIDLKTLASHNVQMMEGLTWLKDRKWGPEWDLCIRGLIELERRHGFPVETKRLSMEERPVEYKQWFKAGRRYTHQNTNGEFPNSWWAWWRGIKTLSCDVDVEPGEEGVDWDELDVPGTSGVFLVVVGLAWWGEKNQEIGRRFDGPHSWLAGVRETQKSRKCECKAQEEDQEP
ncbi:hypothetical protein H0H92_000988 [Tricholoma furcatifolium]|nr:hypothetical protein H0H92_000988 [Tricholoma furcatifolium]